MPPKRNPNKNKEKLEKQRKKNDEERKKRKEKMDKLMEQMAAAREKAERDLKRFKKMELQIEIDKNRKKNKKFRDLKVASKIAEALNKEDKDDDDFGADAISLLQGLEPQKEEVEEEGISIGKLKSALRTAKAKKDKKKKNLLMKGKLKVWGDTPPNGLKLDSLLRRHTRGGRRTRKKRGGDKYFDKHKKIIKDFLEHPEVAKKIKKHKKNKLSINQIMKKITRDKLNIIIKSYARYLKSQKGGKDPKEIDRQERDLLLSSVPITPALRPDRTQDEINLNQIIRRLIAFTEEQEREQADLRLQRNQQRRENRFNMVHSLLFSMFMLLTVFGLMRDTNNVDLENTPVMNILGQGIIMAHQTGLLGTAQNIMLWDAYWTFFNNAWIPGGFTGEDLIVQRQLARFIAPFFPLPELRDDDDIPMPWEGGGTTSPIDDGGLRDFVDRVSPPTIVDRFVVLRQHYQDRHNIFLNTIFNDIWSNKNRTLFNKLKKKAGTNDETVINLMKHEFTIANSMLIQQMDRLVNDFKASVAIDPPHKKYIFRQTTLIDCFDTAKNRDYIARLLDGLNNNHILFFLYVLKFLQIVIGHNRSDTKLNKDGDYEIDPIDNFALLAITISYYRLYRTIQRRDVPQVYNDVCNTILQIHKDDLINKRFIGWQKGGRKKTRKRRKKRKNRKKTRK